MSSKKKLALGLILGTFAAIGLAGEPAAQSVSYKQKSNNDRVIAFQQAGGIDLSPISVELTYGIERFAMALQDVDDVFDVEWTAGVKYRDVRHRDEVEQSKYAFGQVDMPIAELHAVHRDLFDKYYGLSQMLLRSNLALPALDYCLKCSHMFNLLDASGGIGVTERTAYILRVRQLAVAIAKHWVGEKEA